MPMNLSKKEILINALPAIIFLSGILLIILDEFIPEKEPYHRIEKEYSLALKSVIPVIAKVVTRLDEPQDALAKE